MATIVHDKPYLMRLYRFDGGLDDVTSPWILPANVMSEFNNADLSKTGLVKKAKGKSYYFCDTGLDVLRSIELLVNTNDTSIVMLPVTAKDQAGQVLATFTFQWQLRKPII